MSNFVNKVQAYGAGNFKNVKDRYAELATGQAPETLLITCSDSRLCPQEITDTQAGDLFVIRNAGNIMPTYDPQNPSNEGLTLEYGVVALKVKEVVVCGHASCGAMGGLANLDSLDALPLVQKGLANFKKAHKEKIEACGNVPELIEWNVKTQMESLMTYPFVKEGVANGSLKVTGVVYDFVNAEVQYQSSISGAGQILQA